MKIVFLKKDLDDESVKYTIKEGKESLQNQLGKNYIVPPTLILTQTQYKCFKLKGELEKLIEDSFFLSLLNDNIDYTIEDC